MKVSLDILVVQFHVLVLQSTAAHINEQSDRIKSFRMYLIEWMSLIEAISSLSLAILLSIFVRESQ